MAQSKNCKIPGTEMPSGVLLVATCWVEGAELVNHNLDSPAADNPYRARSAQWYQIILPNQRICSRNGTSLPTTPCPREEPFTGQTPASPSFVRRVLPELGAQGIRVLVPS